MRDDPWRELAAPASSSAISARRVDAANPWHLYWALDHDGRCLLVLRHAPDAAPRQRLPKLREIEVRCERLPDGPPVLVLRLLDTGLRDVFLRLCMDIADATNRCRTEAEAVDAAVGRTWRWHHLLRGGAGGRLRPEEQKGLIGELLVLEHHLLPAVGAAAAVAAWRGPVGAAKDFVHASVGVESKARASADATLVPISSEVQLADEGLAHVFLHVCSLDAATPGDPETFTLTDVVARVRAAFEGAGETVHGRFEALLAAAGFRPEDDYSDSAWTGGERSIHRVAGNFPRLTPECMPDAIANVRYMLALTGAGAHVVTPDELRSTLAGCAA